MSETACTPITTGSRVTLSKPVPVDVEPNQCPEHPSAVDEKSVEWGNLLADIYPLVKIMEVQVCDFVVVI